MPRSGSSTADENEIGKVIGEYLGQDPEESAQAIMSKLKELGITEALCEYRE